MIILSKKRFIAAHLKRMHIFNGVKQKDQKLISDIGRFNQICADSVKVNCTENALYLFAAELSFRNLINLKENSEPILQSLFKLKVYALAE